MKTAKKKSEASNVAQPVDMREVPLGTLMRDKVTGWTGIAIAKVTFLNGCVQYSLKPQNLDKDGKLIDSSTIDCQQLEVIGVGLAPKEAPKKLTGGIMPDTPIIR